jgi:hypothetical protein
VTIDREQAHLRGLQLSGSLGSLDGVGWRTISPEPASAWRVRMLWSRSTKCTVPGTDSGVASVVMAMIYDNNRRDGPAQSWEGKKSSQGSVRSTYGRDSGKLTSGTVIEVNDTALATYTSRQLG